MWSTRSFRSTPEENGINAVLFLRSSGADVQRSGRNSFGFEKADSTVRKISKLSD
jgi:hypothetical protein